MTTAQAKLLGAGVLALLAWLLRDQSAPGRVSKELDIDANVNSDTFGMTDEEIANHKRLVDLVDESSRAIADYDAAHPAELGGLE
jgi:hypothetical protein